MFDRVEMDVVNVLRVVDFIFDRMFPVPALPDTAFAFVFSAYRYHFGLRHSSREHRFNQSPTQGIVEISVRQGSNSVQMIGQYCNCVGRKWMPTFCVSKRVSQMINVLCQKVLRAILKINREEKSAACNEIATVASHVEM